MTHYQFGPRDAKTPGGQAQTMEVVMSNQNPNADLTREQAAAILERREGTPPEQIEHLPDAAVIAAALAPEGQPCGDCGALVVYHDDDWHHVNTPTSCFLARQDERHYSAGDRVILHPVGDVENGPHPSDLDEPTRRGRVLEVHTHPNNPDWVTGYLVAEHLPAHAPEQPEEVITIEVKSGAIARLERGIA